jgi:hypothetical protein
MDGTVLDTFSVATLIALVFVVVNFLRNLANVTKDVGAKASVVNQIVAWVAGVVVVVLASQADIASSIPVFGSPLGDFDIASLIIVGLSITSAGGVLNDFFAARDNTRTSANPDVLGNSKVVVVEPNPRA